MKRIILLVCILSFVLVAAGCTSGPSAKSANPGLSTGEYGEQAIMKEMQDAAGEMNSVIRENQ